VCPTEGDETSIQDAVAADADTIALKLTGARFVDNGDGTVTDVQTGLMWEQKTGTIGSAVICDVPTCPADNVLSGTYSTTLPSTGTFATTISASGTSWTGVANDSFFGLINDLAGSVSGTGPYTLSGTGAGGLLSFSATYDCATETVSGTIVGPSITGSLSGSADTNSCPDPHDVKNLYSWSFAGTAPTGMAFTNFLGKLNNSTSLVDNSGCFAGHCDWRLPTVAELGTILLAFFPSCGTNPCIDPIFGPTQSGFYLSATTYGNPLLAVAVIFGDGSGDFVGKTTGGFVRAVRGGL
jgi:hypothetical protein